MRNIAFFTVLFFGALACRTTYAQWEFQGAGGLRQATMTESDNNGRRLVREQGLLPGVGLSARYVMGGRRIELAGEAYGGNIEYNGQLQSGGRFVTDTKTLHARIRAEAAQNISGAGDLILGMEKDFWNRHILGRGATLGMKEQYSSWRLLAGARTRMLDTDWGSIGLKGLLVFSSPEKLIVKFDNQVFDRTEFDTKSAIGTRLSIGLRPPGNSNFHVQTDFEWMRIARSDDAVLRRGGFAAGLVAQPEHVRKAFGISLHYRF
jgi:hypothetical protein